MQLSTVNITFVQRVILPLLQSEEKLRISLNFVKLDGSLQPVIMGEEGSGGPSSGDNFMFPTTILNSKMKDVLQAKFKEQTEEHLENFKEIFASEWDLVYDEENHDANASNRIPWFNKLINGIDGRKNFFFIIEAEN